MVIYILKSIFANYLLAIIGLFIAPIDVFAVNGFTEGLNPVGAGEELDEVVAPVNPTEVPPVNAPVVSPTPTLGEMPDGINPERVELEDNGLELSVPILGFEKTVPVGVTIGATTVGVNGFE